MKEHRIEPAQSWMVGDSPSDIQAGINAGCRTVFIHSSQGKNVLQCGQDLDADDLFDAVEKIIERESKK